MASIVAVVGQTASGKTSLAVDIAKKFNGEIVCADSRTIYKGMDIGTAKPTMLQQQGITHYCLNIINPNQNYSVAQFKKDSLRAIDIIYSKGKVPIIVGGSGLYIDAVLYDYEFDKNDIRTIDRTLDLKKLQKIALKLELKPSEQTMKNKQHLLRFIERDGQPGTKKPTEALILGLKLDKNILDQRINVRVNQMFDNGLVDEAKKLEKKWGRHATAFQTPGYGPIISYTQGECSIEEAKHKFIQNDKNLAKKQMTWFKRNKDIIWISNILEAEQLINDYLIQ